MTCLPSAASSRALAGSISDSNARAGRVAGRSRSTHSVTASSRSIGPMFPATETSALSTGAESSGSISSPEAFPASPSVSPGSNSPRPTNGGSGPSLHAPFASYDPASCSWRTSQGSLGLTEGSETYSGTWPRSGMTRSGTAYLLPPSVPLTSVTGSTSWPTPDAGVANDGETLESWEARREREKDKHRNGDGVCEDVAELKTAQAQDAKQQGPSEYSRQRMLIQAVRWPTPTTADSHGHARSSPEIQGQRSLADAVRWPTLNKHYPTPTRRDGRTLRGAQDRPNRSGGPSLSQTMLDAGATSGRLNPEWVGWLMGFPERWTDLGPSETPSSRKSSK